MIQFDLFAPPPLRVVFPERKCKDCPFADFNANGRHTYPLLRKPSRLWTASPGCYADQPNVC